MKTKTKFFTILIIIIFVITSIIVGRAVMSNIISKKIKEARAKPVGIVATKVNKANFFDKLETFGTVIANRTYSIRIKKSELIRLIDLNNYKYIKKGTTIAVLTSGKVIAPFDGKIGKREITPGILGGDQTIIATLDDIKILKVDIKVPENYIKILKRNLKVEATTSAFNEKFFGRIETISSRVDPTTRSILVQAKIDNKSQKLIPGMLININLIFNESQSLGVPEQALIIQSTDKFVYKIVDDKIIRTKVKIGKRNYGKVEILDGLNEGDIILAEGTNKVRTGSKIKINKFQ